jgi:uncharacterized SAM-binding protein YcdF (DUF218 family)
MGSFWTALFTIAFFGAFLASRVRRWANLSSGFFLTCSLFSFTVFLFMYAHYSQSKFVIAICVALAVLLVPLVAFGVYILIILLFLNALAVLRRERLKLANALSLILASVLTISVSLFFPPIFSLLPRALQIILRSMLSIGLYYLFHVSQYLIALLLCNLSFPRKNKRYVIVLGASLSNGKPTPLLAGRIDRAVSFYKKQSKMGIPPKIIFSGGKGPDEPRSEAEAMAEYALEKGVSQSDILLEPNSSSTLENMKFSKRIMDSDSNGEKYSSIFVTSDFHLLRAGIHARKAGLNIIGIGSKTALYYFPTAVLREYAAYVALNWKQNAALASVIFLCSFLYQLKNLF